MLDNESRMITFKQGALIIHLLAAIYTKDMGFADKVKSLSTMGLAPKEIAEILGMTPGTVRVAKSQLKNKRRVAYGKNRKVG
jgi:hypothetical protein